MRLVQTKHRQAFSSQRSRHAKQRFPTRVVVFGIVLLFALNTLRPLPSATVELTLPPLAPAAPLSIAWPKTGQAAVAAVDYGELATYGQNQPLATASIAKVILALAVLEKHPLKPKQVGSTLTMSATDVQLYQNEVEQNGSRVSVYEGMELTQYEALQAVLIASANNMANTLATWAFGGNEQYAAYANQYLLRHGLVKTHVGTDASGFSPSTTSTAEDVAKIGLLALREPVLMEIAGQTTADLPAIGTIANYNTALGSLGIDGIKTGNNEQNPGALLFSAPVPVGRSHVRVTGAVMGANSLAAAIEQSREIVASLPGNFEDIQYVARGQRVGVLRTAWGTTAPLTVRDELRLVRWRGTPMQKRLGLHSVTGTRAESIGAVEITAGSVQSSATVRVETPAAKPSLWWRLTRIR